MFYRFVFSIMFASFTLIYSFEPYGNVYLLPIGAIVTFFISFYILGKCDLLEHLRHFKRESKRRKGIIILATLLSTITIIKATIELTDDFLFLLHIIHTRTMLIPDISSIKYSSTILLLAITLISLCTYFIIWYFLLKLVYDKVVLFFQHFTKFETYIFYIYIVTFALINLLILFKTNAFVFPLEDGEFVYDIIFTTDSSLFLLDIDAFSSPGAGQNDIRHLLFGIIGIPISMICIPLAFIVKVLAGVLGYTVLFSTVYGYFISVGQAFLFAVSGILIYKILRQEIKESFAKLVSILYFASYSTILFTITVEQYAIGVFTLLLFVYHYSKKMNSTYSFLLAGLSFISSFAMLPFVLLEKKSNIKDMIKKSMNILIIATVLIIFFGQLSEFLELGLTINNLSEFSNDGTITLTNKVEQYLYFIPSMFIAPEIVFSKFDVLHTTLSSEGIRLVNSSVSVKVLSCLLFVGVVISTIINRTSKLSIVSAYWVLISILILVVVGWGSVENSMVLYSPYFMWAYLILIALLVNKVFSKKVRIGNILLIVIIASLFIYNSMEILSYIPRLNSYR